MTYGLKIDTGSEVQTSNISQLNSNSTNKYMFGNFSTIPSNGKINLADNELLFIHFPKPASGSAAYYALEKLTNDTFSHRIRAINYLGEFTTGTVSGEMCIVSDMSATLSSSFLANSNQEYGLQVKNSDGTIILDTRGFGDGGNFAPTFMVEPVNKLGIGLEYDLTSESGNSNAKLDDFTVDSNSNVVGPYILFGWTGVTTHSSSVLFVNMLGVANKYFMKNSSTQQTQAGQSHITGYFYRSIYLAFGLQIPVPNSYGILLGERFT